MHTRSKRTGDLSLACSIRNFGRWSWTAVWSSIGMFTSPNEIDPFQSARAIRLPTSDFRFLQLALSFEPVVEGHAVAATALQVAVIGAMADLLVPPLRGLRKGRDWLGCVGFEVRIRWADAAVCHDVLSEEILAAQPGPLQTKSANR